MIDEVTASPVAMKPEQSRPMVNSPREALIPSDTLIEQRQQMQHHIQNEAEAKSQSMHSIKRIIQEEKQKQQEMDEIGITYDKKEYKRTRQDQSGNDENRKKKKLVNPTPQWATPYVSPHLQVAKAAPNPQTVIQHVQNHRQDKFMHEYSPTNQSWAPANVQAYSASSLRPQHYSSANMVHYGQNQVVRNVDYAHNLPQDYSMPMRPSRPLEQVS